MTSSSKMTERSYCYKTRLRKRSCRQMSSKTQTIHCSHCDFSAAANAIEYCWKREGPASNHDLYC